MPQSGTLQKLSIAPCSVSGQTVSPENNKKFQVMINPESFTHEMSIQYHNDDCGSKKNTPLGQPASAPKFLTYPPSSVNFTLVLDGTGVVQPAPSKDVSGQIKDLKGVVYKYEGDTHEPNVVQIVWGSFLLNARLDSLKMNYTLFKPSGEPLRAKVALSFKSYVPPEKAAAAARTSSPDLSHVIEVKAGDTLPLLCYRIYKDASYYAAVAKANGLVNFRRLEPGKQLHFPPLR
jgi:hypothetical protein